MFKVVWLSVITHSYPNVHFVLESAVAIIVEYDADSVNNMRLKLASILHN